MASEAKRRSRPPKATLATLTGLGAERLAELLLAAAKSDTALKRALTLEVTRDPGDASDEVLKQLDRLRAAKGRVNSVRAAALARELSRLLDALVLKLSDVDPGAAMLRLLDAAGIASVLLARRTGEGRPLLEAFASIADRIAGVLQKAEPPVQVRLIADVYRAALADDGLAGDLLASAVAKLGPEARAALTRLVEADLVPLERDRRSGAALQQIYRLTEVLALLADAAGDVDGFEAAQARRDARLRDHVGLAQRFLDANRPTEALAALDAAPVGAVTAAAGFKMLRIQALDACGRRADAQADRWRLFETSLSVDALRGYLKRLPDFEDVEREEAALHHATAHPDTMAAIAFLTAWPDHRKAGALIRARQSKLDGDAVDVLAPAAEALAYRDPLAATLLLRAIIDFVLRQGRTAQFGQAGRLLVDCSGLAASIRDWEGRPEHAAYVVRLKSAYGRRKAFWRAAGARL